MRSIISLMLWGCVGISLSACAPIRNQTHFERWDEAAKLAAAETPDAPQDSPAKTPAPAATPTPRATPATPAGSTTPAPAAAKMEGTPPIKTATVAPPSDEDVIY